MPFATYYPQIVFCTEVAPSRQSSESLGDMSRNRTPTAGNAQNPAIIRESPELFSAADFDAAGRLVRQDANTDALAEPQLAVSLLQVDHALQREAGVDAGR
jgi:hypothetical protein